LIVCLDISYTFYTFSLESYSVMYCNYWNTFR